MKCANCNTQLQDKAKDVYTYEDKDYCPHCRSLILMAQYLFDYNLKHKIKNNPN